MRLTVEKLRERSQRAWSEKRRWYDLHRECYAYAIPGLNPFDEGGGAGDGTLNIGGGAGGGSAGQSLVEHLYDGTLAAASLKLASKLADEAFPVGQHWSEMSEGPDFAPAEPSETKRGRIIQEIEASVFDAITSSNFALARFQLVLEGVVTGTGVMKVGASPDPSQLISFDPVPQWMVAMEAGPRSEVWAYYRKLSLTAEMVQSLWPGTDWKPDAKADPMQRYTVLDCSYYHPVSGVWYYDVLLEEDAEKSQRIWEEDLLVSPWVSWRYSLLPGEVQGRSPVMSALPDARTANEMVRILLEAGSMRSAGTYLYENDGSFNPDTVTFHGPQFVPVKPRTDGGRGVYPLEPAGDVNLSQLILSDLREGINTTMLANTLPPLSGPVRSATEIVERTREAMVAFGGPFMRLMEEVGRPVLRAVAYELARKGHLPELQAVQPQAEDGEAQPLMLDGTDVGLRFVNPLVNAQRLADIESFVQASQIAQQAAGPAAYQAGLKVEDIPEYVFRKLEVDQDLVRDEDERSEQLAQAQAAPQGGLAAGAGEMPEMPV